MSQRILAWGDFETSGLDENNSIILEGAFAIADFYDPFNYKHVFNGVIHVSAEQAKTFDPFIINMHTKNGLLKECESSTMTVLDMEQELLKYIPDVADKALKPTLAGSSIGFDKKFIDRYMPTLAKRLIHRIYDVSGLKLHAESKGMPTMRKAEAHRAKDDIEESVQHAIECDAWLKDYYRSL